MANVSILSGDITVYFDNDASGDKQILWTGSTATTATRTVNELYSALQDLFDNNTATVGDYMDSGSPMRAITPTQYELGRIEVNDETPWFIDQGTIEHLTGGSIQSVGWTSDATFAGIIGYEVTSNSITNSQIGEAVTDGTDNGILLYVDSGDTVDTIYIRPNGVGDDFNAGAGLTVGANSATFSAGPFTGENLWINLRTLGTIVSGTDLYVTQRNPTIELITSYWPAGPIDRLILTERFDTSIDNGYLSVYAREPLTLYDNFLIQTTAGQNIVPLSASADINDSIAGNISANGINVNFAGPYTVDIDPVLGSPNENYSIEIDVAGNDLTYLYRYLKQYVREDQSTAILGSDITGAEYTGIQAKIDYASETGTVNIGDRITGSTSGSYGYVVNKQGTYVMLTNTVGDFTATENLANGGNSLNNISNIEVVTPNKQAPFGSLAGGRFFGARGVYLLNFAGGDVNNYQLLDDDGNVTQEEIQVSFSLTGLRDTTEVRIFQTSDSANIAGVESMSGGVGSGASSGVTVSGSTNDNTFAYTYVYSSDITTYIQIVALGFEIQRLDAIVLGNTNTAIPIQQRVDRNYSNP